VSRSQIIDNLYVSGFPEQADTADVDLVVNLAGGPIFPRVWLEYVIWPIEDSATLPNPDQLRSMARHVADLVQGGKNVLCHCGAGINRANLIAVRALMFLGYPFGSALNLVRERRDPNALSNQTFVDWLRQES